MAFLIPENLASRNDVPARIREVAAALRDSLPAEVTLWLENLALEAQLNLPLADLADKDADEDEDEQGSQEPFLAAALPGRGLLLVYVLEGGRRALGKVGSLSLGEDPLERALEKLREHSRPGLERLRETSQKARLDIPVAMACAAPQVSRSAAAKLRKTPARSVLFAEDFVRLREAVSELFDERRQVGADQGEREREVVSAAFHPEVVIRSGDSPPEQGRLALRQELDESDEGIIKVLDRRQEMLARWLGGGYRVIKGVAGSGKTLVLVSRAKLIGGSLPNWRVLLTCYNRVLADELAKQVAEVGNVTVKNIDRLPFDLARETKQRNKPFQFDRDDDDFEARIELCVDYLEEHPQTGMFDFVLVDETQDFDPKRLEFAYRLLKPGRRDFVVARDAAQNVYRRPAWLPSDTSGRGRTKILSTNYRNTREVLHLAFELLMMGESDKLARSGDPEIDDVIIEPDAALRQGPLPQTLHVGRDAEVGEVCDRVQRLGREGVRWDEIAVLCGNWKIQGKFEHQLKRRGTPCLNLAVREQRDKAAATDNHVLIASLKHLKGLEFPHVFLTGLEDVVIHEQGDDDTTIRRFLYVAMTRSTRYLTIMVSGERPYLRDVQKIVERMRERRSR